VSASEIERQFTVEKLPEGLDEIEPVTVLQGYLAIEEDGTEVRIRRMGGRLFLTVKRGGGMVRTELETEIDLEQFEELWPGTEGRRIEKSRHAVPLGDLTAEVDVYAGRLAGLISVEVEFASREEAARFDPPAWFGREVTHDERYKNRNLALHGAPER
jgi:CYTH domain-containing protein